MKFSRKIMRAKERAEQRNRKENPLVWALMVYKCSDCDYTVTMYLENTLERNNGDKHKPVPFAIRCPKCGGFHCYDNISMFRELPEERPLEPDESYFKDDPKYDCGVPVMRGK